MTFKIGDKVKIDPYGEYAFQIEHTDNTIGTLMENYRRSAWAKVKFGNGYENIYKKCDLIKIKLSWKERMKND